MTGEEFSQALISVGWNGPHVARLLGCDRKLVWFWSSGQQAVPAAVAGWITRVAEAVNDLPPPQWRTY